MLRKAVTLAIVPLVLLAFAQFGTMKIIMYSWNQVVDYQTPYTAPLPPGPPSTPVAQQVLLVVVDGLRTDVSRQMPVLEGLRAQGAVRTLRTGQPSLSYPTWTTLGAGAWQETDGVTTNWYTGSIRIDTIFARARAAGLSTAIVGTTGWTQLYAGQYDYARSFEWQGDSTDDQILAEGLRVLAEQRPNFLIVHFDSTDENGHLHGGASAAYRQAALATDARIGRLRDAFDLTSGVFAVTSDHGHIDTGGHGGWEPVVTTVPLVMVGKGIVPGAYPPAEQVDIAPTLAVLLGTAVPSHSQGIPLWDSLELSTGLRAARAVDVAAELSSFYGLYARLTGAAPFDSAALTEAQDALKRGDDGAALAAAGRAVASLRSEAAAARNALLWRGRLARLPLALALLLPFAAWLYVAWRGRWDFRWPLISALVYFLLYNALFFGRGNAFSLSAFNSESQVEAYFVQRGLDALIALLVAGCLAGFLARGKDWYGAALAGVNTLFLIAFGLALQAVPYIWFWGAGYSLYLPDLGMGFKYYLDIIQTTAFYPKPFLPVAAILPFLTLAMWRVARRFAPLAERRGRDAAKGSPAGMGGAAAGK